MFAIICLGLLFWPKHLLSFQNFETITSAAAAAVGWGAETCGPLQRWPWCYAEALYLARLLGSVRPHRPSHTHTPQPGSLTPSAESHVP